VKKTARLGSFQSVNVLTRGSGALCGERRNDPLGDPRQLVEAGRRKRRREREALEAVRPRVLQRVCDPDHRHLASKDITLERHLGSVEQLLGEEAVDRVDRQRRVAAGLNTSRGRSEP
jgi:hypothetical protein